MYYLRLAILDRLANLCFLGRWGYKRHLAIYEYKYQKFALLFGQLNIDMYTYYNSAVKNNLLTEAQGQLSPVVSPENPNIKILEPSMFNAELSTVGEAAVAEADPLSETIDPEVNPAVGEVLILVYVGKYPILVEPFALP